MMVGIDFETANKNPNSACSIGIVVLDDVFNITEERYFLIKPPTEEFEFTYIHGLTYDDVKNAKTFGELWDEIKDYFNNNILFAHNAGFDMNVLSALFKEYNLKYENIGYFCTMELARKLFPNMKKVNLKYVAEKLNYSFNHHNALEDSKACYEIVRFGFKKYGISLVKLLDKRVLNG